MSRFATDLSQVANELPAALVILEPDGTISWTNQATADLLQLEQADWLGRSVFDVLHDDDHAVAFTAFESVGTQVSGSLMDVRIRDGAGQWRQTALRGRMVPSGAHGEEFIVIVLRDVADR